MGLESETSRNRDAFVTRFDLCSGEITILHMSPFSMISFSDLNDYGPEATSNQINSVGNSCKNDMKWTWSSGFKNKE